MLTRDRTVKASGRLVGFLDAGSTKNVCLIVVPERGRERSVLGGRIVGASCLRSRGVKAGVVSCADTAAEAVRACVSEAERTAGDTLGAINVGFSCGRLKSEIYAANTEIANELVSESDVAKCLRGGQSYAVREGRRLVHMNEVGYRLDENTATLQPQGMAARRLSVDLHAVTADEVPLRNLAIVIEKAYLDPGGFVIAPYASAMAVTSEEERSLGITIIDIGGGTAKIAMFSDGQFVYADVLTVGADLFTADIARTLQTPFSEAERIKTLYGTLVSAQSDSHETFSYKLAGGEDGGLHQSNKAAVAEILSHRAAMIGQLILERIERSGVSRYVGNKIVLTGGGSELVGTAEFMAGKLQRSVRVARPAAHFELPNGVAGPAFSTVVGMVASSFRARRSPMRVESSDMPPQGYLGRVTDWLKTGL